MLSIHMQVQEILYILIIFKNFQPGTLIALHLFFQCRLKVLYIMSFKHLIIGKVYQIIWYLQNKQVYQIIWYLHNKQVYQIIWHLHNKQVYQIIWYLYNTLRLDIQWVWKLAREVHIYALCLNWVHLDFSEIFSRVSITNNSI